jgi:hypothetical protein
MSLISEPTHGTKAAPPVPRSLSLSHSLAVRTPGRYIHAVKMCNEQQLILKKVGYLTTALVLDEHHELIILIINTLQQDLRSDNYLVGACPNAL